MLWGGGCKAGVTTVRFQPNHPPTKHGHTDPTLNKEVGPVDRAQWRTTVALEDGDNRRCQGSSIPTLLKRSRGGPTSPDATTLPLLSAGPFLPVYRKQVGLDETSKTS
jgi:hypothetical protein